MCDPVCNRVHVCVLMFVNLVFVRSCRCAARASASVSASSVLVQV